MVVLVILWCALMLLISDYLGIMLSFVIIRWLGWWCCTCAVFVTDGCCIGYVCDLVVVCRVLFDLVLWDGGGGVVFVGCALCIMSLLLVGMFYW